MVRPLRRMSLLPRFARADRGATAVEFALISIPLMILIFGIVELALVLMVASTLQFASEGAARDIRTGQFQQGAVTTAAAFETLVCGRMSWLQTGCAENLAVQAQVFATYDSMAQADLPPPPDPEPEDETPTVTPPPQPWGVGGPCDIVLVRTFYRWPITTPLLGRLLEDSAGSGVKLISSTTALRNEPWDLNPTASMPC